MKTSARFASLLLIVLGSSVSACSPQQQQQAQANVQQASSAAKQGYLVTAVMAKLAGVDVDATTNVHVSVSGGVATLSGQAKTASERARYDDAARTVNGINAVRDQLSIDPHLQGAREKTLDGALEVKVSAAIASQAGVNVFHVTPVARGGVVTLTGSVPSRSVDRTIVQTARAVPGVRSVVDRLSIR